MEQWVIVLVSAVSGLLLLLASGMPIGFALGLLGILGLMFTAGPVVAFSALSMYPYGALAVFTIIAVPLFILMSEFLTVTTIGEDLYDSANKWLGRLPGGLAMSSVGACAVFAAMCGSSLATAVAIGSFAIPEMEKKGYASHFATGTVAAAGALGILIPPSLPLIFYGFLTEQSVGKLFIGGIIPGVILAVLMMIYIGVHISLRPALAPRLPGVSWRQRVLSLRRVWAAILLILLVLGGIYGGICTTSEAAGVGAFGALCLGVWRREMTLSKLRETALAAGITTGSVLIIYLGAMMFGFFLSYVHVPQELAKFVASLPLNRWVVMILINVMLIGLGCVLDVGAIIMLTSNILYSVVTELGFDPIWFGVVMVVNMEMAVITPPVGLNLFAIKSIAPHVSLDDIMRGSMPFLIVELITLALVIAFPQLILWLPNTMIK